MCFRKKHIHPSEESAVGALLILTLKTPAVVCKANNNSARPSLFSLSFSSFPLPLDSIFITTPISSLWEGTLQKQHHCYIPASEHCASRGLTANQARLLSCFYGATSETQESLHSANQMACGLRGHRVGCSS